MPIRSAVIGFIFPCDGMTVRHQVIEHSKSWGHVPMRCPNPAYFDDERFPVSRPADSSGTL